MRHQYAWLVLTCGLLLIGCATTLAPFSAAEQAQVAQVQFIKPYELSRTDVTHVSRGEVSGEACLQGAQAATQQQALLQLKLAAAQQQANVVVLKHCLLIASSPCGRSWQCRGDAHQQQPLQ